VNEPQYEWHRQELSTRVSSTAQGRANTLTLDDIEIEVVRDPLEGIKDRRDPTKDRRDPLSSVRVSVVVSIHVPCGVCDGLG
jgi:hypothetical protein